MRLKNKNVLLTGGCGFIGSSLIPRLLEAEISNLLIVDKMSYASTTEITSKYDVPLVIKDITKDETIEYVYNYKPDIIINMAAESHVDNSITGPEPFFRSNTEAVFKLLEGARRYGELELFLQINTDEIYGSVSIGFSKETDPIICSSPYSSSKGAAELLVQAWHTTFDIPIITTRSSNNYGPYQHVEKLIPKAITNLLKGNKVPIYGDGENCRDWIHVEDNCNGLIAVLNKGIVGQFYNLGGNNVISNNTIISQLCKILNLDFTESVTYVTDRLGHDKRYALDSTKAMLLGWKPQINLEVGLKETIEWYRNL